MTRDELIAAGVLRPVREVPRRAELTEPVLELDAAGREEAARAVARRTGDEGAFDFVVALMARRRGRRTT